MRIIAASVGALALLAASTAAAQDSWRHVRLVLDQLGTASERIMGSGNRFHEAYMGKAPQGGGASIMLEPASGRITVIGMCDADCNDMDIQVLSNGQVVASDMAADDNPVVVFNASSGSRYTVKPIIATCTSTPCFYAFSVFDD